jgi:hypothetical protein
LERYVLRDDIFFEKWIIIISQRYQLNPTSVTTKCPKDNAHNPTTKRRRRNKRSHYSDQILSATTETTAKTTPESKFFKSDA